MRYQAKIIEQVPLAHDFVEVKCQSPYLHNQVLPGHFIWIKEAPIYIMGQSRDQLTLILPASLISSSLMLSEVQGNPFAKPHPENFHLLIVENNALSACLFYLKKYRLLFKGIVFIGTTSYFPFYPCPSRYFIEGIPPEVIAAIPLLEDWGIVHRLASTQEQPGCFQGSTEMLGNIWMQNNKARKLVKYHFSCMPG